MLSNLVYLIVMEIEFEIRFLFLALDETFFASFFNVSYKITSSEVSYGKVVELPTYFNSFCWGSTILESIPLAFRYNNKAFFPTICLKIS